MRKACVVCCLLLLGGRAFGADAAQYQVDFLIFQINGRFTEAPAVPSRFLPKAVWALTPSTVAMNGELATLHLSIPETAAVKSKKQRDGKVTSVWVPFGAEEGSDEVVSSGAESNCRIGITVQFSSGNDVTYRLTYAHAAAVGVGVADKRTYPLLKNNKDNFMGSAEMGGWHPVGVPDGLMIPTKTLFFFKGVKHQSILLYVRISPAALLL